MCGIVGALRRSSARPLEVQQRRQALGAIRHRGPDTQGEYSDNQVWLGHTRLSILDLSEAGRQPMTSLAERYVLTYNGEVYNFKELAMELGLSGLRSSSDTEVILEGFAKVGPALFEKLNGMFALSIYDRHSQKMWLVRDRMGIKPLYYEKTSDGYHFSSEIKALLQLISHQGKVVNISAIHEWLYYGNTLGENTLYEGIVQLLPGHYLELDISSFTHKIHSYWTLERQVNDSLIVGSSLSEIIAQTKSFFFDAVRRQLVSDVPVGVFLSGGVDSSAITAVASQFYKGKISTYSAGFDDMNGVDERPKARRIAELYKTDHHELTIRHFDVATLIEKMVHHHDMPFSDAANIPLYVMAAQISGHTKVILQGDGGDELFGGYRRYVSLRYRSLLKLIASGILSLPKGTFGAYQYRFERYFHAYATNDIGTTMALLSTPNDQRHSPTSVFKTDFRKKLELSDPFERYKKCQQLFSGHDIGNQMSFVDLKIVLPDTFLEKVDRATMAASLEVRVPFLDHDLVDYVVRIPGKVKMPWGKKKWLLKKALAGVVPDDVLYGRKTGFNVPFGYWLKTSLKSFFFDHLNKFTEERPHVLDKQQVVNLYEASGPGEEDRTDRLWKLLNFMVWLNNSKERLVI